MSAELFIMPLRKGKTNTYKTFLRECLGPRKKDYEDLLSHYGLNSIQIWVSTLANKDYAIFIHDMNDNAKKLLENWATSNHPFDRWFNTFLNECYEIEDATKIPTNISIDFLGELDSRLKSSISGL